MPNMKHALRAEVADGAVTLWLDRQPLGTHQLPGLEMPAHVGLASYSMLGGGPIASFASVEVEGGTAAPVFDATPQPKHNWVVSTSSDGQDLDTTSIGNAVRHSPDRGPRWKRSQVLLALPLLQLLLLLLVHDRV